MVNQRVGRTSKACLQCVCSLNPRSLQLIEFSVSIYPSVSKQGFHAIAISNRHDESIVLGFTQDPIKARELFQSMVNTDSNWEHDEEVDYHRLVVKSKRLNDYVTTKSSY